MGREAGNKGSFPGRRRARARPRSPQPWARRRSGERRCRRAPPRPASARPTPARLSSRCCRSCRSHTLWRRRGPAERRAGTLRGRRGAPSAGGGGGTARLSARAPPAFFRRPARRPSALCGRWCSPAAQAEARRSCVPVWRPAPEGEPFGRRSPLSPPPEKPRRRRHHEVRRGRGRGPLCRGNRDPFGPALPPRAGAAPGFSPPPLSLPVSLSSPQPSRLLPRGLLPTLPVPLVLSLRPGSPSQNLICSPRLPPALVRRAGEVGRVRA